METQVVLGVAAPRAPWFSRVGAWSSSGIVPVEFVRCLTIDEVFARAAHGQAAAAVLVDGRVPGIGAEQVSQLTSEVGPCIVVDDVDKASRWRAAGAADVLPPTFTRDDLVGSLNRIKPTAADESASTDRQGPTTSPALSQQPDGDGQHGTLVAVTGSGGAGASTLAIALAQGLSGVGREVRRTPALAPRTVLLADFCREADQAMLHNLTVRTPALVEVCEQCRLGGLTEAEIRELTFAVPSRGYRLLAGLRQGTHWAMLDTASIASVLKVARSAVDVVVADVDRDLDGVRETGSLDIEERNGVARTAMAGADLILVAGTASLQGLHAFVRVVDQLLRFGVPLERIRGAIHGAPRSAAGRASVTRALRALVVDVRVGRANGLSRPLLLPRWRPESALRDGRPLPRPVPARVARNVHDALMMLGPRQLNGGNGERDFVATVGG
ncbi:MAG: hypothetical protein WD011_02895 [Nitriliruptoraceae bacterium]